MFDLFFLILFIFMAVNIVGLAWRKRKIYSECNLWWIINYIVFLFILGPIIAMLMAFRFDWMVISSLVLCCYLPGFMIAYRHLSFFENIGIAKSKGAEEVTAQLYGASMIGFMYTTLLIIFMIVDY